MNPLLQSVATDVLFSGDDILSFTFFLETIIVIRVRPKFLKHLVSARRKRVLFFSGTDSNGSSFSVQ